MSKILIDEAVVRKTLEALEQVASAMPFPVALQARKNLREALSEAALAPPECKNEAEKTAFAFGWFKALESVREQPAQQEPVAKVCHDLEGHIGWNPDLEQLPVEGTPLYATPPAPAPVPEAHKPLTDEQKKELIKKSELWDMHIHIGWYSAPVKSFVEKATQLIADIEAAHGITSGGATEKGGAA